MPSVTEILLKLLLTLIATGCLFAIAKQRQNWVGRHARAVLVLLGAISVLAWFNFGAFHDRGGFRHNWEQLHYVLGSKYFPELGYDGLYAAAVLAIGEFGLRHQLPEKFLDQRNGTLVPREVVLEHGRAIRSGFSEERWKTFGRDLSVYRVPRDMWQDHGYNPTPAWTFTGRLFTAHLPITQKTSKLLGLVDVGLLALVFLLIWRTFGLVPVCCAMIIFGLNYNARFYWTGGAFFRQDWLAAVTVGICMLQRQNFTLAGLALAYAASVRVFPVLFLVPIGIYAARCWKDGQTLTWVRPLIAGLAVGGAIMLIAGGLTGRGFEAWFESAERLQWLQSTKPFANDVGLRMPFITSLDNLRGELTVLSSLYDQTRILDSYHTLMESRSGLIWAATLFVCVLVAWAAWRAPSPAQASVLGLALIFALLSPTCYYWVMLLLMPLRQPLQSTLACLIVMLIAYVLHPVAYALYSTGYIAVLNSPLAFSLMSGFMTLMFIYWLMPGRDLEVEYRKTDSVEAVPTRGKSLLSGK